LFSPGSAFHSNGLWNYWKGGWLLILVLAWLLKLNFSCLRRRWQLLRQDNELRWAAWGVYCIEENCLVVTFPLKIHIKMFKDEKFSLFPTSWHNFCAFKFNLGDVLWSKHHRGSFPLLFIAERFILQLCSQQEPDFWVQNRSVSPGFRFARPNYSQTLGKNGSSSQKLEDGVPHFNSGCLGYQVNIKSFIYSSWSNDRAHFFLKWSVCTWESRIKDREAG